ncbi:MAG: 50S ribosomal protein L6 [Candidatus Coatesbacteria bacterium]|nr:50S ribosomal protein L6 [Candidatus Coatesbacteria bacterium]
MSRIGANPIPVPDKVDIKLDGRIIHVKGPRGELSWEVVNPIAFELRDEGLCFTRPDETKQSKSLHGLARSLTANMIQGVTEGFEKKLEIRGTGYRAQVKGSTLLLNVGFCHPVEIPAPEGIAFAVEPRGDFTLITVSGIDKQLVGETAARIRRVRPPEPYKGKGIRYDGEWVRQKAGKATVA